MNKLCKSLKQITKFIDDIILFTSSCKCAHSFVTTDGKNIMQGNTRTTNLNVTVDTENGFAFPK